MRVRKTAVFTRGRIFAILSLKLLPIDAVFPLGENDSFFVISIRRPKLKGALLKIVAFSYSHAISVMYSYSTFQRVIIITVLQKHSLQWQIDFTLMDEMSRTVNL